MAEKKSGISRRKIIKLGTAGLVALPLGALFGASTATAAQRVEESDSLARDLGYRHDAEQADASKREAGQFCRNCQFYQGDPGAQWGGCLVFGGREVNTGGWCTSWRQRVG